MKHEKFYDKEFSGGLTTVTRGELEGLPCPFCTENVSDETMQDIINNVDAEMTQRFGSEFSFEDDNCAELWYSALEDECNRQEIPYYEDLEN